MNPTGREIFLFLLGVGSFAALVVLIRGALADRREGRGAHVDPDERVSEHQLSDIPEGIALPDQRILDDLPPPSPDSRTTAPVSGNLDDEDRLRQITRLHADGLLSDDEFAEKRRSIIDSL